MEAVTWVGAIAKIQTMADGGGRLALDVPDVALARIIGQLVALRGKAVRVAIVEDDDGADDGADDGPREDFDTPWSDGQALESIFGPND